MELNFFDTNPVVINFMFYLAAFSLKNYLSGIEVFYLLCVSKCYRTEPIVIVRPTVSVVEIEHSRISSVVEIAPTFEERIREVRKVRVVQFNPVFIFFSCSMYSMNKREQETRKYLKCYRTEPIVKVRPTESDAEIDHSRISTAAEIAPTNEERRREVRKVRAVSIPAILPTCTI